jgi:DDE superfamily endonuclease
MENTKIASDTQANIHIESKINRFFDRFQIGTLLHRCGIRKRHGHSVRSLTEAIFSLPFTGKNFFRGIVISEDNAFGKDAAYQILRGTSFNWRRLLLCLGVRLFAIFNSLTDDNRESVLIIDDSTYDRSRSKWVELLSRVYDHSTGRFLKGFRMLSICWSDGVSCLPLDFSLLSSSDAKKRICENQKQMDQLCCAYRRRKEATVKATALLKPMVKRILNAGIQAKYLLMDSWFTMPSTVIALAQHINVIGMVKKSSKIHYTYNGKALDVTAIYRRLKKRRGRAKILASAEILLKNAVPAKLVFVRDRRKKDWLVLLSTDISLADDEIVRIYGKRWDIEVFFKMAKQTLKLASEIQCRDFDALIAHTSFVFMRYMFLSYQCRMETDERSLGDLFYACCDEIKDISFMEALYRILTLVRNRAKQLGEHYDKTANAIFDVIIDYALKCVNLSKNRVDLVNA